MITKLAGIILIVSYTIAGKLPFNPNLVSFLWLILVIIVVLGVDALMGKFITSPLAILNKTAYDMANLDFSQSCAINSKDEFGELSSSLNQMSIKLQETFSKIEAANIQLKREVESEHKLLIERKELVDSLSHEMKTPLGVIRAYAEGLLDEKDELKKQKYSEIIISEIEQMNQLINTLLDLSALESGAVKLHPERFDFVEFLETVAGRLLIDIPDANFSLQYRLPDHKVYVLTDKVRMEQVLNNLIINAKKNIKSGGILKLHLDHYDNYLMFQIYNQGNLISPDNLNKIWNKFYREQNSSYTGSGLGLAIVSQILSMQDYLYGVKNMNDGVMFFFSIPCIS